VWLMLFFFALSGIFVFLKASFLAAVQLFIYVGAVIVLYIFVMMMMDFNKLKQEHSPLLAPGKAFVLSLLMFLSLAIPLRWASRHMSMPEVKSEFGSTPWFAQELYRDYPFPIELASILLIISLVGAFALTRKIVITESVQENSKQEKNSEEKQEIAKTV
jgi:NADH-quinone oxidoreductase subunit J